MNAKKTLSALCFEFQERLKDLYNWTDCVTIKLPCTINPHFIMWGLAVSGYTDIIYGVGLYTLIYIYKCIYIYTI